MSLYGKFKTDKDREQSGISLELGRARIQIARAGGANQKFRAEMTVLSKQYGRALQHDLLSDEKGRELLYGAYSRAIVLNWETNKYEETDERFAEGWEQGIETEEGGTIPFTPENVVATFKNLPVLFDEVKGAAEELSYFRANLNEQTVKNS